MKQTYVLCVGKAYVKYLSPQSAAYARDKLDMFEYPPGYRMNVQLLNRCPSQYCLYVHIIWYDIFLELFARQCPWLR